MTTRLCVGLLCLVGALGLSACCFCDDEPEEKLMPSGNNSKAYQEWFAHHPSWARRGDTGQVTPQPPAPASLFQEAKALKEPLQGDMLLCQFAILKRSGWDALGGDPDPAVDLTIGQGVERRAFYGDGVFAGTVAWAGVDLKPQDVLRFDVLDIDLSRHDLVGTHKVTWAGELPFAFEVDNFKLECRGLKAAQLKPHIKTQTEATQAALKELERASTPDPGKHDWGAPEREVKEVRRALTELAGLQTWAAAPVRAQVARLDELQAAWDREVRLSIKKTSEALPGTDTLVNVPGDFKVRVLQQDCNATAKARATDQPAKQLEQRPCYLTLKVKYTGQEPQSWTLQELKGLLGVSLVDAQGVDRALELLQAQGEDGATLKHRAPAGKKPTLTLAPEQSLTLVLEPDDSELRMEEARLLRFQAPDSQQHRLVRLR